MYNFGVAGSEAKLKQSFTTVSWERAWAQKEAPGRIAAPRIIPVP